ncbi:MAG: type 4a pilus biogenesis protein PilO [Clostridia bacterium]|nr:type 4a pilus biogenesis protein PilO [Clostridia bacterium]
MNRLTEREQVLIIIALLLGFAYIFTNYFWQPLSVRYTQTKADLAAKRAELEWLKKGAQGETKEKNAKLMRTYEEMAKRVPDSPRTAELLYLLEEKAALEGITLLNMQLMGEPQVNNQAVVMPVVVETTGSNKATLKFLSQLESFPRLITVPGFTWQYTGDKLAGRFQLAVYSWPADSVKVK